VKGSEGRIAATITRLHANAKAVTITRGQTAFSKAKLRRPTWLLLDAAAGPAQ
jgi:hypothetical protein